MNENPAEVEEPSGGPSDGPGSGPTGSAEPGGPSEPGRPGGPSEPGRPNGPGEPDGPGGFEPADPAPGGEEFLDLERELAVLLRRARASSGEMAREVHPDLEPGAYGLLVCLAEEGGLRATDLAAFIGVGKATMSRQLRSLEEHGIVAREPDPEDGRASRVRLTEAGRDRFQAVRGARRARYMRRLADWDSAEVSELARLLGKLNAGGE